ncbi:MAG: hypothetical protein HUU32_12135 [Calditrichaceae bacterium]|nr:hypothetical protein [Calditrichia bacterium]NUQ42138.1 hypothetical protein [Calditrichaceae bacterium]
MNASHSEKQSRNGNPDEFQYPLREPGDRLRFYGYLFLLPIAMALLIQGICGYLLFPALSWQHLAGVTLAHGLVLGLFLFLLWIPVRLTILDWNDKVENFIIYLRSIVLLLLILALFPHDLAQHFLAGRQPTRDLSLAYWVFIGLLPLIYLELTRRKLHYTAFRDIRTAADPRRRRYSERWVWYEAISFFTLLLSLVVVELWFSATLGTGKFVLQPAIFFIQKGSMAGNIKIQMEMLAWFCSSFISGLIFFLSACLGNRLIGRILIPVTFHERDMRGIIQKTYRYLWHFLSAMLFKQPFLLVGGFAITLIFLGTPIVFVAVGHHEILSGFTEADQIILALVVFVAWFSPLTLSAVHPDETFGEYFNRRLADLLMVIQGHLVVIGFGSLGKRVLEREVRLMLREDHQDKSFMEVVTPDLRLERLSSYAVVIERDPQDVIFSGETSLLGRHGVVSTCREPYKTRDPNKNIFYDEKRVLAPVIIGEAREPFISSRVNLERARLIISTVPEEGSVQTIFDRANQARVNAIICVSRSDQISYLTYRARHRRIVLVYPKHNQGTTLGHRLWAAMVKVRSIYKMEKDQWPKVLIVGNNKATQFMLETLWIYLPGTPGNRTRILKEHFAFIVTSPEQSIGYPILKEEGKNQPFDLRWPALLVTSSRFPYQSGESPLDIRDFLQLTRVVNEADQNAIQACIEEHQPHILVLNHDAVDKSPLLVSRCVRALERLKSQYQEKFHLPLILLTAVRGDDRERQVLGDASRYYDAVGKMYKEPLALDASYPSPARYAYYAREVIGESISDALADAEEVIAGARRSFSIPIGRKGAIKRAREKEKQFVEISTCLPNRPGALANFLARMAGVEFDPPKKETIEELWRRGKTAAETVEPHMPSFQYMRNIILDPAGKGYALTGYALLVPIPEDSPIFDPPSPETSSVVRIYANDGRNYLETEVDPDELYDQKDSAILAEKYKNVVEPPSPGVPNVIDRLTRREAGKANNIGEFREVLLDPEHNGKYACPGMSLCRVAAFQDYVTASNYRRLARQAEMGSQQSKEDLRNARNYYCCTGIKPTREAEKPAADSSYARVFCCAYGTNDPGMIAMVLNTLIFRPQVFRPAHEDEAANNWVINIDYFKDVACQNSYFAMNRVFGYFQEKKKTHESGQPELPLHLIRILPIGGVKSAKLWFTYARALYHFIDRGPGKNRYRFYWIDGNHQQHLGLEDLPAFREDDRTSSPIVIVIKRTPEESKVADPKRCKICGLEPREYDCSKLRVWI